MWNNNVQPNRPQTMHMRTACWMPVARDTYFEYVILIAFS